MFGTRWRVKGRFELRNVGSLLLPTNNVSLRVILQLLQILLYSPYKLMCQLLNKQLSNLGIYYVIDETPNTFIAMSVVSSCGKLVVALAFFYL